MVLGLAGALASYACGGESNSEHASEGSAGADAGDGGTASGGRAGTGQGGSAARGGTNPGDGGVGGGRAGASGEAGDAGAAGSDPGCSGGIEPDDCPYPESRDENGTCSVTPNAWYPIGDSAPDWPERGATGSRGLPLQGVPRVLPGRWAPRLAMHDGAPAAVVAACEVYIWDSGTWEWQTPPQSFELGEAVDGCNIEIDRIGQPIFTHWVGEESNSWEGHAARWLTRGWDELPAPFGTLSASDWGPATSLTFSATNTPFLAWEEFYNDESQIFAVRFSGASDGWEPVGPAPILSIGPETRVGDPRLSAGPDGELALHTSIDDDTVVLEWDGDEWLDRSDAILNGDGGQGLVHDDTGAPVIYAFGDDALLLFRWSGTRWDALEPDEATLGKLPEHVRFAAWVSDGQVYVRRFANCRWTELSASARGGGVSNAPAGTPIFGPSLAVSDGRVCVAWTEGETDPVVRIRCHDLPRN